MKAPAYISDKNSEITNNWLFTSDVLEEVLGYNLFQNDIWVAANTEIAKAQFLLNLYKTAFKVEDNHNLYELLKDKKNFEGSVDYVYFKQYITDSFLVLRGRLELWHKRPTRQYMRDRFFFVMNVLLSNLIATEYLPDTDGRDLKNKTIQIIQSIKSNYSKNKADKKWEEYRKEEDTIFECFKEDYEYEGNAFFPSELDYLDKIDYLVKKYTINGKKIGINKAKKWYSAVCVKK